ncbi:DUF1572 domain-containing protein [Rossellomorea aquimaris]|nr:DUF1572 domain-containing protein [Rossellomorea vietnamensis]
MRNKPLSVLCAVHIEAPHISYHVGQILYVGKMIKGEDWEILSIPKQ